MGGGATMRAASKVAGFAGSVINRNSSSAVAAASEHAVRKSSIPVSATLSSSSASSSRGVADVAAIQKATWEVEEWEDLAGEAMPRVVFGGVASFDEAKEATLELKDALNKAYLSSPESVDLSDMSLISKSDSENKSEGTITVSNHAMKAFKLLSSSPEAQNVVASIASDENVWNAVMNNPVLQDFIQSNNKNNTPEKTEEENDDGSSAKKPKKAKESRSWFQTMFEKAKISMVNLVNRIFGPSDEKEDKNDRSFEIGGILGLVTMVVMVVVFKRI